jgi:UDP-glucose 4-epimerase
MRLPFRYLIDNGVNGMRLIEGCVRHGIMRFVLSSTAALYGTPKTVPIIEDAPLHPESPYGDSKWFLERTLHWAERVHGLRYASLRYFNAAGADPAGRFGEDHRPETHLIPLVIDAALGRRGELDVYGDDYTTPDGTCLRDYIQVTDLIDAHMAALAYLRSGGKSLICNCGYGRGYSVKEVIEVVKRVSGVNFKVDVAGRRAGDPAAIVAKAELIRRELGWRPRRDDLEVIVRQALDWERRLHNRQG